MYNLDDKLKSIAAKIIEIRRNIHKYPESGWNEYRTTSYIATFLQELGYEINMGTKAIKPESRLAPPNPEQCAISRQRAIAQGADPVLVQQMGDGLTGLWLDIGNANRGPIIALRFDIDAISSVESSDASHTPQQEDFASCNHGYMHACGHDGHVAIGLGLALILHDIRHELNGVVRLIFQPAEEVGQGAKAMLDAGVMQDVQELIGIHLGVQAKDSETLICGTTDFLAVTSFELSYSGKAAHAGLAPQEGNNALMAAVHATQGILSISRHGHGETRLNIGQFMVVDGAPNIIPAKVWLAGETRGIDSNLDSWMQDEVLRISKAAAQMWDCTYEFKRVGTCLGGYSDKELAQDVYEVAQSMPCFKNIILNARFLASEDFTWLLQDVQERGGKGTYIQVGVNLCAGHHNEKFNFDESGLMRSVELLARLVMSKMLKS